MQQNCNKRESEQITAEKRHKIAVLFGGCSPEYGVSLQSAAAVLEHMDKAEYEPVPIGITHTGDWFYYTGKVEKIVDDSWCSSKDCIPVTISLNRGEHSLLLMRAGHMERMEIDAALPILHGRNGEDGTVQGLFELAGIPVVGCGVLSSALCMDKDRAHKLAKEAGIRVPVSYVYSKGADFNFVLNEPDGEMDITSVFDAHGREMDMKSILEQAGQIGYPLFVKPVKAGSSYGITKVSDESGLCEAIKKAFAYDERIIIEENIFGFEVGCAVMGTEKLTVGEVDEIELSEGFFDFTEKYTLKTSEIHVPAKISPELAIRVKESARTIYRALDCSGFARVDMFITGQEEIVFNEINTIPGFTSHSRFPNMMKAAGISFEEVISGILQETFGKSEK